MADMHLCYGATNANAHSARRLYAKDFLGVSYQVTCIFRQWTADFVKQGRVLHAQCHDVRYPLDETLLGHVAEHPGTSTRVVAGQIGISRTTV
ncbi:hypothetical protein PR048_013143 [Dryococelus australis]|uniref:Uncharacterized protein n=1 Tax=Dryococelus australis TaxID=614101 RepID=A0ABQ9HS51_9NEOP|nr:hypothetical protein PR048_013143 [Dryococelus australis]